jgi:hypothetical protein
MTLQILAVLTLGLMCGSELNVAAFAHPTIHRQPVQVQTLMRSSFARLFGRIMPFWMPGSAALNVLLLLPLRASRQNGVGSRCNRSHNSNIGCGVFAHRSRSD